ncbi:MAG: hybrid sensor histidine kinase/response regulator [Bacteroidota bacterium]
MSVLEKGISLSALIVEDNPNDVKLITRELGTGKYAPVVTVVNTEAEFKKHLTDSIDIILCDFNLPNFNAFNALEILKQSAVDIPFIVVSGTIGEETAVELIKRGAADYLMKDRLLKLTVAVENALSRKIILRRQRQTEGLLRKMMRAVEQSADSIVITDTNGIIEYVNPAFRTITDFSPDEVIGKTHAILKSGMHAPEFYDTLWKTLLSDNTFRAEFINRKKDGTLYYIDQSISPVHDETGAISHYVSTGRDVTQRKEMEQSLKESEERYRNLIDSAKDAIFTVTTEGILLSLNKGFERITGWKMEEWIGKPFLGLIHPDDQQISLEFFRRGIEGENIPVREYRILTSSHEYVMVEVLITFVRTEGAVTSIIGIARDITERKQMEEHLRQVQKMDSIGTLAGGIAHDFNNILGIILGHTEMLRRNNLSHDKHSSSLEIIQKAVDRGRFLVRQILTFARQGKITPADVSANDEIKQLILMLSETIPKTIVLKTEFSENIPLIHIDPTQLHQSLLNLSVNARDTIMERMEQAKIHGIITFATRIVPAEVIRKKFPSALNERYVAISVGDNGMGMTREVRKRIFDPFFTTKGIGHGTGLGLAVVFGVVESHYGFIEVDSTPNVGTTFTQYFPERQKSPSSTVTAGTKASITTHGTETILIIEDEDTLADLVMSYLIQSGYTVLLARNGVQGVEAYQKNHADIALVLTDFGLPLLDGMEVVKKIRMIDPKVKVIMATGYLDPSKKAELLELGIGEPIFKPYGIDSVLQRIRQVLDGEH